MLEKLRHREIPFTDIFKYEGTSISRFMDILYRKNVIKFHRVAHPCICYDPDSSTFLFPSLFSNKRDVEKRDLISTRRGDDSMSFLYTCNFIIRIAGRSFSRIRNASIGLDREDRERGSCLIIIGGFVPVTVRFFYRAIC